jgi:hypothetical protein
LTALGIPSDPYVEDKEGVVDVLESLVAFFTNEEEQDKHICFYCV